MTRTGSQLGFSPQGPTSLALQLKSLFQSPWSANPPDPVQILLRRWDSAAGDGPVQLPDVQPSIGDTPRTVTPMRSKTKARWHGNKIITSMCFQTCSHASQNHESQGNQFCPMVDHHFHHRKCHKNGSHMHHCRWEFGETKNPAKTPVSLVPILTSCLFEKAEAGA